MPRSSGAAALLLLIAGCDAGEPSPNPREELSRSFLRAMKTIDLQNENLQADLAAGRPPDEVRGRLASIKAAAEEASRLRYRASEAENREIAFEFRKFLETVSKLEGATWSGDEGNRAWRRLNIACNSCHDVYREDADR